MKSIELRNIVFSSNPVDDSFFIKIDAQQVKLKPSEILYIESMRDYVKIYTENRDVPYIPLMTLKKVKVILTQNYFLQINRSQIINISKITSFGKNSLSIDAKKFIVTDKFQNDFDLIKTKFIM